MSLATGYVPVVTSQIPSASGRTNREFHSGRNEDVELTEDFELNFRGLRLSILT